MRLKSWVRDAALGVLSAISNLALRAAIPLGRWRTARRLVAGKLRSVWGVTPILTLPLLARCDRLLGIESASLVFDTYRITRRFDISLERTARRLAPWPAALAAFARLTLAWALVRFDVFHTFCDRGILPSPSRFGFDPVELQALERSGKRLYAYAYGADVRTRTQTLALGPYNFCMDCPKPGAYCICNDAEQTRVMSAIRKVARATVAMADMVAYAPGCQNLHYWPIDVDATRYVGAAPRNGQPIRILHAPNHEHFKGTRHLLAAVDSLKAQGVAIDLRCISGVSNEEVRAAMAECDVLAEQFIGGAYGYTAVEAWAMGKPVLTYVRDPSVTPSWEDFPAIVVTPATLESTLRALAEGRHDLPALGVASRRYAEKHYSLEAVARRLAALYRDTADLPEAMRRHLDRRIVDLASAVDRRLETPLDAPAGVDRSAPAPA